MQIGYSRNFLYICARDLYGAKMKRGVRVQLDILWHQVTPPLRGMGYNLLKGPIESLDYHRLVPRLLVCLHNLMLKTDF